MSRRALLVFLPFALTAMVIAGTVTAGSARPGDHDHAESRRAAGTRLRSPSAGRSPVTPSSRVAATTIADRRIRGTRRTRARRSTRPDSRRAMTVNIGVDLTAPTFPDPPDIGPLQATSPAGAQVTYSASATDNLSNPTVVCNPPSGSVFPVGPNHCELHCHGRRREFDVSQFHGDDQLAAEHAAGPLRSRFDHTRGHGPSGASVTYSAHRHRCRGRSGPDLRLQPASGRTFPLGIDDGQLHGNGQRQASCRPASPSASRSKTRPLRR